MGSKSTKPTLAEGQVSRDEEGAFCGAGGHVGLDHTQDGTNVQAINVGGAFGWGGDEGLYGGRANATLAGAQHDPAEAESSGFWGGIRTFDAGASAYHDADAGSGELGYRADIISGELGYRQVDAESDTDRGLRVGAALGAPSGGLRWYNQDADGDGVQEYGIGASVPVGPVGISLDYTTESPAADAAAAMTMAAPGGMLLDRGMEAMGLEEYAPSQLLERGAESLWDWATGSDE